MDPELGSSYGAGTAGSLKRVRLELLAARTQQNRPGVRLRYMCEVCWDRPAVLYAVRCASRVCICVEVWLLRAEQ